jgi:hypothetical protein
MCQPYLAIETAIQRVARAVEGWLEYCHRNCHRTADYVLLQRGTTPMPNRRKVQ